MSGVGRNRYVHLSRRTRRKATQLKLEIQIQELILIGHDA